MVILPAEQRSVTAPNGSQTFGVISDEIAVAIGIPAGEVRLLQGFQSHRGTGFGLAHLHAKPNRAKMLEGLGFRLVESFVWFVTSDYEKIARGSDERIILLRERSGYALHVIIEWREERTFWSVVTGLPKRAARDEVLWEKTRTDRSEPRSSSAVNSRFATLTLPKSPTGKGS